MEEFVEVIKGRLEKCFVGLEGLLEWVLHSG